MDQVCDCGHSEQMHRRNEAISSSSSLLSGGNPSSQDLELQSCKQEAVKNLCDTYKQYTIQSSNLVWEGNQPKITTGLTKEKMFSFRTKKPEESSSNWKPWHKDWDAITSNYPKEDAINDDNDDNNAINDEDKYRYNRKTFLEDDERSDDSIFIVDPGWDDYSLQAIKLNRSPYTLSRTLDGARM
ncbi:hypothetical protein Tco_0842301 [Tanacetum coccineum]|uniref:Uncharacterized protein n=1 Tax=Tanacetum coccineum TaxID=301880 RepID=A0ABQ5B4J1_9ASTR